MGVHVFSWAGIALPRGLCLNFSNDAAAWVFGIGTLPKEWRCRDPSDVVGTCSNIFAGKGVHGQRSLKTTILGFQWEQHCSDQCLCQAVSYSCHTAVTKTWFLSTFKEWKNCYLSPLWSASLCSAYESKSGVAYVLFWIIESCHALYSQLAFSVMLFYVWLHFFCLNWHCLELVQETETAQKDKYLRDET